MEVGNRSKAIGGHHSASCSTTEWLTPQDWILALGPFDLDPCAPIKRPWPTATRHFTIEDNGLAKPWSGLVWCNPPYSSIAPWTARCADHGNGFLMVFARTETAWFHDSIWDRASSVFFLRGRLNFCTPGGLRAKKNAGGPTVVVSYGEVARERLERFALKGHYPGRLVNLT